jgi:hypothetical protein
VLHENSEWLRYVFWGVAIGMSVLMVNTVGIQLPVVRQNLDRRHLCGDSGTYFLRRTGSVVLLRWNGTALLLYLATVIGLLSVLPQWCAPAEEGVHAFLTVLSEKVAGNGVSSQAVGVAERQLELTVEDLLAGRDGG